MGDPKKRRKQYSKPRKSFQKERILKEKETKELYGLKNKREFYRTESIVRAKRATARKLLALDLEERLRREKELLDSLIKVGMLRGEPTLEDVLVLTPEALLERRLETIVWRKGLANTANQARQFITHGHIAINGKKVDKPSYIVTINEEPKIAYFKKEMIIKATETKKAEKESEKKQIKDDFEAVKVEDAPKKAEEKVAVDKEKKEDSE